MEGLHPPPHSQIPWEASLCTPGDTGQRPELIPESPAAPRGILGPPNTTKLITFIPVSWLGCSHAPAPAAFAVSLGFLGGHFKSHLSSLGMKGMQEQPGRTCTDPTPSSSDILGLANRGRTWKDLLPIFCNSYLFPHNSYPFLWNSYSPTVLSSTTEDRKDPVGKEEGSLAEEMCFCQASSCS